MNDCAICWRTITSYIVNRRNNRHIKHIHNYEDICNGCYWWCYNHKMYRPPHEIKKRRRGQKNALKALELLQKQ